MDGDAQQQSASHGDGEDGRGHFPLEDIVHHPLPGFVAPTAIAFSPDDRYLSYLFSPEGTLSRKLFSFDPRTREQKLLVTPPGGGVDEANISLEEKLRRERLRERGLGVTRYEWAKGGPLQRLIVPLPDGVYVQDGIGAELRLAVSSSGRAPVIDPQLSPDGAAIGFVQEDELFVAQLGAGGAGGAAEGGQPGLPKPLQLTFGARAAGRTHGCAEYIAQEEMDRRSGFWWSLDSKFIAYAEVDSSRIPMFRIMHQGKATVGSDAEEEHPYPFTGQPNVRVRLGVVPTGGGQTVWMDLECAWEERGEAEEYLARVTWMPDGSLIAQLENREQTKLALVRFNPHTGARLPVLVEESKVWVNLHDCFTPLHKAGGQLSGGFIWASERTGFRHLYLYDAHGACLGALTGGEWMVESVAGVDEMRGLVYFTGTADSTLQTHLYAVPLAPDAATPEQRQRPQRLTSGEGRHHVVLNHALTEFVDTHDALDVPPRVSLCSLLEGGRVLTPIFQQSSASTRARRLPLTPPEIVQVPTADGTVLYGAIYHPDKAVHGQPPYKTVVSVYGGPHVQTVSCSWMATVDMRAQYLRSRGFLVWKLDNRGSSRRGLAFEGAVKHRMGTVDVEDQEAGVRWLIRQGLADAGHIGIYGWSYGGYMAAMALARFPGTFRCAVAGAPVTAWDGYDTHYTERYMGTPTTNPVGFEKSSVMHHVSGISGKLMLVHGMIDENVHFRHSARLINALTAAAKEYELLLFPDERHMPRGLRDRMYMEERIFDFLDRNL